MTSPKRNPASYIDKLNRLNALRAKAGKDLHTRVRLAYEIYNDPDYRAKMASDHQTTVEAISPDDLALAIDNTWPDLIAIGFDWTGFRPKCGSLQTIYQKFPNKQDWIDNVLPDLWAQCEATREKQYVSRRSATLKQLEERDKIITRHEITIKRLEHEKAELQTQVAELQTQVAELTQENKSLRHMLANTPSQYVA